MQAFFTHDGPVASCYEGKLPEGITVEELNVYRFILMDNEANRSGEVCPISTLKVLSEKVIGWPVEYCATNTQGVIFDAFFLSPCNQRKTVLGEDYSQIAVLAHFPQNFKPIKNMPIKSIPSFAYEVEECSVCGCNNKMRNGCNHFKKTIYDGQYALSIIKNPYDWVYYRAHVLLIPNKELYL